MVVTLTLSLFNGSIGQEIFFICTEGSGSVQIQGISSNLVTTGTNDYITLNAVGESVHLLAIDNGSGVPVWYIVGGQGYVLS